MRLCTEHMSVQNTTIIIKDLANDEPPALTLPVRTTRNVHRRCISFLNTDIAKLFLSDLYITYNEL